jgi:hypothetical protein
LRGESPFAFLAELKFHHTHNILTHKQTLMSDYDEIWRPNEDTKPYWKQINDTVSSDKELEALHRVEASKHHQNKMEKIRSMQREVLEWEQPLHVLYAEAETPENGIEHCVTYLEGT